MTRKIALFALALACLTGLGLIIGYPVVSAQTNNSNSPTVPVYFPYPPGLIPPDLQSETIRVMGEIDRLEQEAMSQWQALPLNTGTAMRQIQLLGKIELFDKNLSVNRNVACSFCHMPYTGFSGPISSLNATTVAYPGSVHYRFGKRKPQGYTYSPYYPVLQYNQTQSNFYGGNFRGPARDGIQNSEPRRRAGARTTPRHPGNGII